MIFLYAAFLDDGVTSSSLEAPSSVTSLRIISFERSEIVQRGVMRLRRIHVMPKPAPHGDLKEMHWTAEETSQSVVFRLN